MAKRYAITIAVQCLLSSVRAQEIFLQNSDVQEVTDDPLAWRDTTKSPEERATLLVNAMNFTEKAKMLSRTERPTSGVNDWTGGIIGIERLKVPEIRYQDGPQGFRDDMHPGTTTSWPCGQAFGQTWDMDLIKEWGQKMGQEFKDKGAGVQLGPGMNVMRVGLNGRDFEYVSGEDPYLGSVMVDPLIKGIQSNGIMANMKHYINNNQEINRIGQSANIDERTQVEMYFPPFESAINAGVDSAMCSYNKVNHIWACANNHTLNYHMKERMGFEGFVMSDWGATHSGPGDYIPNGLDQEQNGPNEHFFFTPDTIKNELSDDQLDKTVHRIVKSFIKRGLFDEELPDNFSKNVTSVDHQEFARKGVSSSTVLLKNERSALPLSSKKGLNVLVLGTQAAYPTVAGDGSGHVKSDFVMPPLWAICDELGVERISLSHIGGFKRCNKQNGNCVTFIGILNDIESAEDEKFKSFITEIKETTEHFKVGYDATLLFASTSSGEGWDRSNLHMNELAILLLEAIPLKGKVITSIVAPGPVVLNEWKMHSDAMLFNTMPG